MAIRSIRSRLLVGLSLCAVAVIFVGSGLSYGLVRRYLYGEFDVFLEDKLRYLQISAVQNGGRISFRISQPEWKRIDDPDDPEFFQFSFLDGRDIYRSQALGDGGYDLPRVGLGADALVAHDCVLPNGNAGRCMGLVFRPDRSDPDTEAVEIHLVVARDREEMNASLSRLRWLIIAAGGVATVGSLAVTALIVGRTLRPMGELSEQIDTMPVGGSARLFVLDDAPTEVAPVVDRLNLLMGRVDRAIENERQFTANAAHELRNPLAGLRSQLELALGSARDPEADEATFGHALKIQAQMEGVVGNLLTLARLESGAEKVERQTVEVRPVLRHIWKPYFDMAADRGLRVRWDLDGAPQAIETAPQLFQILLSNLFDNAASYTPEGGEIRIAAVGLGAAGLRLEVANTNPGVEGEQMDSLFQRFRRGDASASGGAHAGIGLGLCQRIVATLGGELKAEIDASCFRIALDLPAAS